MNAYESGERKAVPAVLVYPRCGGEVLMLHRVGKKAGDFHQGKWNGLGGKCEPGESPLETAQRELAEESGLDLPRKAFRALGTLHFPDFKPHKKEDWLVFVLTAAVPARLKRLDFDCPEGELHWVPEDGLLRLNLWEGDRRFLPLVKAGKPFVGTFWYADRRLKRWWLQRL